MSDLNDNQNHNKKIYEIVNKYYYDIESITVYFGSYCIFSKEFKNKEIAWFMLFLIFCITYHAVMVIVAESSALQAAFLIYIYNNKVIGWIVYFLSLIIYVITLMFIDTKKKMILEDKYGVKKIQKIQDEWLKQNLPESVNFFSLVSKSTEWFRSYHKVNHNDFLSTGKLLQNSKVNIVVRNLLGAIVLAVSAKFLGGVKISEIASKYPNETVLIAFNLFLLILSLLFLYNIFQIFAKRFFSAIDGKDSKSSYRFNIFNRMLLHHVTIKELDES